MDVDKVRLRAYVVFVSAETLCVKALATAKERNRELSTKIIKAQENIGALFEVKLKYVCCRCRISFF